MNNITLGEELARARRELAAAKARAAMLEQEIADVREAADEELSELREALNRKQPLLTGTPEEPIDATKVPPCPNCGYHVLNPTWGGK